jgi:hypothetical protein
MNSSRSANTKTVYDHLKNPYDHLRLTARHLNNMQFETHNGELITPTPCEIGTIQSLFKHDVNSAMPIPDITPYTEAYLANPQDAHDIHRIDQLIEMSSYAEEYFQQYVRIHNYLFRTQLRKLNDQTEKLKQVRRAQREADAKTTRDLYKDNLDELTVLHECSKLPVELRDIIASYLPEKTVNICLMWYAQSEIPLILGSVTKSKLKHAEVYVHRKRTIRFRPLFANAVSDNVILPGMSLRKTHGWEAKTHRCKSDYVTDIIGQVNVYDYIHNIFIRQSKPVYHEYASLLRDEIRFTIQYVRFIAKLSTKTQRRRRVTNTPNPL